MAKECASKAIAVNIIDPMVNYIVSKYNHCKIGVIGTKGTIKSRAYKNRIEKKGNHLTTGSLATPLLAPMIEEGFFNNHISQTIINAYLDKRFLKNIDALILGCTHYPLIKKEISTYYNNDVEVIDSANIVAQLLKIQLAKKQLLAQREKTPNHQFFISDYTEAFEQSTKVFFKKKIKLKAIKFWQE